MTVEALISEVLNNIRNHWYADRVREFKRDERALMKAILRYGYECNQRDWQFEADFIFQQLMALLLDIRRRDADIEYLPNYLDGAVKRWIGQRAEELSAQAKAARSPARLAQAAVAGVQVVAAVREKTAVETCAEVFQALNRQQRARRKAKAAKAQAKQQTLL